MTATTRNLAELLGSRICHDLISPIGAIGNGLELLSMSGGASGPEMALINDSLTNANTRIRYYRIAYGAAGENQAVARQEIVSLLSDLTRGSRLKITWHSQQDVARRDAKLLFLLIQCCETAMPYGGEIGIQAADDGWHVSARAQKIKPLDDLWSLLEGDENDVQITPAQVQFGLALPALRESSRKLELNRRDGTILISLSRRVRP
ncbi:MAG: histidine phosphotransferase family protein [Qingshengfaniella sp.]